MDNEKRLDDRPLIRSASGLEMPDRTEDKPSTTNPTKEEKHQIMGGSGDNDVAICMPENTCIPDTKSAATKEKEEALPKDDKVSARELKTQFTTSCVLVTLAGAAIFGGLHDRIGNENSRFIHRDLFKACSYSLYSMFFTSGCLLILSFKKQKNWLTNLAICGALGSAFFATAFALCLLLDVNLVGIILVMASAVLALVLVFFVVYCSETTNEKLYSGDKNKVIGQNEDVQKRIS